MTDRELRKLRRLELLELLTQVTREKEELQRQVAVLQAKLEDRQLLLSQEGTMAEAALRLSGVLEDIDEAGKLYLYNIQQRSQERTEACDRLAAETRAQSAKLLRDARREADQMVANAQRRADAILSDAQARADAYWADLSGRLQRFYDQRPGLREAVTQIQTEQRTRSG